MPFGSSVSGFGTSSSDQDMFLVLDPARARPASSRLVFHAKGGVQGGERAQSQRHCEEVARIVQSFLPGCQDVQKVLNARVPIVKYSHQFAGLECDLQMSSSSGFHMSCLLHLWAGLDWRVRPLVATVRAWARAQGLVKDIRPTHFFTNFTLTLLVVCYLQQMHGMLPSVARLATLAGEEDSFHCEDGLEVNFLHDVDGRKPELNRCYHGQEPLVDLLQGFFHFAAIYDFDSRCLCPVQGESRPKSHSWRHSATMDIMNPLETDLNISYNVNRQAVKLFQLRAAEATATLQEGSDGGIVHLLKNTAVNKKAGLRLSPSNMPRIRDMDLFSSSAAEVTAEPVDYSQSQKAPSPSESPKRPVKILNNLFEHQKKAVKVETLNSRESGVQSPEPKLDRLNIKNLYEPKRSGETKRIENLKAKYLRGSATGYKHEF